MKFSLSVATVAMAISVANAQVGMWGQCGGNGYNGPTNCVSGATCQKLNDWYYQCLPGQAPQPTTTQAPPEPTTSVVIPPTTTSTGTTPTTTVAPPAGAPSAGPNGLHAKMVAKGRYYFGTAVDQNTLSQSVISNIVKEEFGMLTPENSMKWESTQPSRGQWRLDGGDYLVNYAQQNGKHVRGHTLLWHSQLPGWVSQINDAATLTQVLENHVTTLVTRWKGKIQHWDVANEVFEDNGQYRNSVFYRLLGERSIEIAFRAAAKADPNCKLYLNDYNLDYTSSKLTNFIALVNRLKAAGVPIHGVGTQSHLMVGNGAIPTFKNPLQMLHDTGLDVAITELDIRMKMPSDNSKVQQQSRDFQTVVKACLDLPRCVGITVWGVSDKDSWVPSTFQGEGDALLWNNNYQKKEAYTAVANALA
ncbi:endo-1,4-beta-xylanase C precursor [Ascobolus immersus RN42]|uniref:Beta-xylanase n=1 Tax=Ascobolus immersus RN42 TaxID=1160509 RepID=A0A3N4IAS6_ASCIM|nr:endo-1,4-beta-xylanase C precursor [Ascobolus immersus RN42]